jgi:hypothetical protein
MWLIPFSTALTTTVIALLLFYVVRLSGIELEKAKEESRRRGDYWILNSPWLTVRSSAAVFCFIAAFVAFTSFGATIIVSITGGQPCCN